MSWIEDVKGSFGEHISERFLVKLSYDGQELEQGESG